MLIIILNGSKCPNIPFWFPTTTILKVKLAVIAYLFPTKHNCVSSNGGPCTNVATVYFVPMTQKKA